MRVRKLLKPGNPAMYKMRHEQYITYGNPMSETCGRYIANPTVAFHYLFLLKSDLARWAASNFLFCKLVKAWISRGCGCTPTSPPPTPVFREAITSSAGFLETCPSTGRRPTVCSWPAYDILVLHFKCQPLSAGSCFPL